MAPGDQPLLVLGTHNFAPELHDLISETPGFRVNGFVENVDRERTTMEIEGLPVDWIDDVDRFAATHRAVCALGTTTRHRLIEEAAAHGLLFRGNRPPARACLGRAASSARAASRA